MKKLSTIFERSFTGIVFFFAGIFMILLILYAILGFIIGISL